ncbi:cell division protein [Shewanella submarina]|uniref:Cell division inhibitor SulA n=1 Tax=Shewanella submarina TaxID=2016376 RepID=A0ABV7GES5_9GAMM|nr:SulA-like leucine-rich domain-containing protein [Shewanella submarina]MCL1038870.1 cell division protein [Shewanella submarina]
MNKLMGIAPRHPGLWQSSSASQAGQIHTLQSDNSGLQELQSCAPQLAQLSQQGRWVVLINAPKFEYKRLLAQAGVRMDRILLVRTRDEVETLWAMERALTSGTSSAVITWSAPLDARDHRRLQLVAKSARATGWLIEDVNTHSHASHEPRITNCSPASLNLHSFH